MIKKILLLVCSGVIALSVAAESVTEKDARLHVFCDNGEYARALPLVDDIITDISYEYGKNSPYLITSYHNKAVIDRELYNYAESKISFGESIRIAKSTLGNYHPALVGVLIDFGVLYYEMEENELAIGKFREAQHIAHHNDGVYTLTQLPAIDWLSVTLQRDGSTVKADVQERFYYKIHESNYPKGDLRMLLPIKRLGYWLKNTGQLNDAMILQEGALVILQESGKTNEYQRIPILREMSSIAYLNGKCCRDKPLEKVLVIMENNNGGDVEELIRATLHLADMKLLSRKIPEAGKLYKKAWDLRSNTPNSEDRALKEFDVPVQLGYRNVFDGIAAFDETLSRIPTTSNVTTYYPEKQGSSFFINFNEKPVRQKVIGAPVLMCFLQVREFLPRRDYNDLDTYYMDLGFSVKQNGVVSRVEVKDSNTPTKLAKYVKKILSKLRYRPKIENGIPVPSQVTVRQTFNDVDPSYMLNDSFIFPERMTGVKQVCRLLTAQR